MNSEKLGKLLADLNSTPGVEASAIVSSDGLVIGSTLSPELDEDMVGAMGAAMVSLGIRTVEEFGSGEYEQIVLAAEQGRILAIKAGESALIILFATLDAELDTLFTAAHQVAVQVKRHMEERETMQAKKGCAMTTRDLVVLLADLAEQIEVLIGKRGTISVFRYAGRQMGKRLGAGQSGDAEMARSIVAKFFQDKEFMDAVTLQEQNAELRGCRIGLVLQERGIQAGSHALCNFGFGLIDGVTESVTGKKIITLHVASEQHELGITCHETW